MFRAKHSLPLDVQNALRALTIHIVPPVDGMVLNDLPEKVVQNTKKFIFEFPGLYRVGFLTGILLFEWLPLFFGHGLSRFSLLPKGNQEKYIHAWHVSRFSFFREFFKAIKGLIQLICFSDSRFWPYLGYDPEPHMQERIRMREEILAHRS